MEVCLDIQPETIQQIEKVYWRQGYSNNLTEPQISVPKEAKMIQKTARRLQEEASLASKLRLLSWNLTTLCPQENKPM